MEEQALKIKGFEELVEGKMCYWKTTDGWLLNIPGCGLAGLRLHNVVENPDGTITVTPSILTTGCDNEKFEKITRHGYLTNGVWKEC